MPVLKYHNGTAWTEVSAAGAPGPTGPAGAVGPAGPPGGPVVFGDLGDVNAAGATANGTLTLNGGVWSPGPVVPANHGDFTGLVDDDHPQYYNEARGDARYLQTVKATWTPGSNWKIYTSSSGDLAFGDLLVTRVGDFVVVEGMLQVLVPFTLIAASGTIGLGVVPVGFRPATTSLGIMTTATVGGDEYGRLDVNPDGNVVWLNNSTVAISPVAGFWVAPLISYRAAP